MQNRPELRDLRLQESAARALRQGRARALLSEYRRDRARRASCPPAYETVPGRYGAVGVNVNIPIFNGGLFKARQTEAELRAKAAQQNVNDLENRVARDVRVA